MKRDTPLNFIPWKNRDKLSFIIGVVLYQGVTVPAASYPASQNQVHMFPSFSLQGKAPIMKIGNFRTNQMWKL